MLAALAIGLGSAAGSIQLAGTRMYGTKSAGITMAQQQRASRKKRNQARHKARVRA
jgi:hypothetical protein